MLLGPVLVICVYSSSGFVQPVRNFTFVRSMLTNMI